jgi:hypothetical protein
MSLGFRVKSGWAAVVLLSHSRNSPAVVDSRVIELADPAIPHSRQPYHTGFGTAQTNPAKVDRLVRGVERFARRAIRTLVADYRANQRLRRAAVVVASLTDPTSIANQHMRAHASEGKLFRDVLVDALERCGVTVRVVLEREVYDLLGKRLHRSVTRTKGQVASLGAEVDRWRAEQKVAAAGAWLVG